ncbi:MAG: DUF6491 family protein [Dyella sp.]
MIKHACATVLMMLALGACSSVPEQRQAQHQAQRQAAFVEAAGAPINRFNYTRFYAWEALGPRQMALFTRPDEAWLLSFKAPCYRLDTTTGIALTSQQQQVWINFDQVTALHGGLPCTIIKIQPVDMRRLKAAQTAQRQIQVRPRPSAAAGE